MDSDEQKDLVKVVKDVHDCLRYAYSKSGGNYASVWEAHIQDTELRKKYSRCMLKLATQKWPDSRIHWCSKTAVEYFYHGGLQRCILRKVKCLLRDNEGSDAEFANLQKVEDFKYGNGQKLKLLDVGSCYNPFSVCEEFDSYALDLTPATQDVFPCDFLKLEVRPATMPSKVHPLKKLTSLPPEAFHVVVFSLVLEYLPAAEQRLLFCCKSWELLRDKGLLLIVTPDSKSVNHNAPMMKSWKSALQQLGFTRFRYEKLTHFHCMAYWKSSYHIPSYTDLEFLALSKLMYIPQDFKTFLDKQNPSDRTVEEDQQIQNVFSELPLTDVT